MSYNKLYYSTVNSTVDGNKIFVELNILCPLCVGRPQFTATETFTFNVNKTYNATKQTNISTPCCSTQITLKVAVHKEVGMTPSVYITIPEAVIPENWWGT